MNRVIICWAIGHHDKTSRHFCSSAQPLWFMMLSLTPQCRDSVEIFLWYADDSILADIWTSLFFISQTADMSLVHLISLLKINHRVSEHTLQLSSLFVTFNMIIILVHVFQVVLVFLGGVS